MGNCEIGNYIAGTFRNSMMWLSFAIKKGSFEKKTNLKLKSEFEFKNLYLQWLNFLLPKSAARRKNEYTDLGDIYYFWSISKWTYRNIIFFLSSPKFLQFTFTLRFCDIFLFFSTHKNLYELHFFFCCWETRSKIKDFILINWSLLQNLRDVIVICITFLGEVITWWHHLSRISF